MFNAYIQLKAAVTFNRYLNMFSTDAEDEHETSKRNKMRSKIICKHVTLVTLACIIVKINQRKKIQYLNKKLIFSSKKNKNMI